MTQVVRIMQHTQLTIEMMMLATLQLPDVVRSFSCQNPKKTNEM